MASTEPENPIDGTTPSTGITNTNGWDGKLRVDKKAIITNPEALSDPEYSDEDAPPVEQIAADEDLLEDYEKDTEEIDLVHRGVSSIPALKLERFEKVRKICLRQNQISKIDLPPSLEKSLVELDLYDNLIGHLKGLQDLALLTSLDLSFNKLKHIRNISHLKELRNLYFVQNRISRIEGLDGLDKITNLELAANRIREIENLETLTSLEQLWLAQNKISEIKHLDHLTNLTILSIQSNRLTKITGLDKLTRLEELYIADNVVDELSGLDNNTALRTLDISRNPISSLKGLAHLTQLVEFWASSCRLDSFDEVEKELADKKDLETVYFEGNPLQLKNPVMYRNKVKLALPQIKQIDATYVKVS